VSQNEQQIEAIEIDDRRPTLAQLIQRASEPARVADAGARERRRAEAEELFRPLIKRGQSALTALGIAKRAHLSRIEAVTAINFEAARRGFQYGAPALAALKELEDVGRAAALALKSRFSGARREPTAIDPPDLGAVMEDAEAMIEADAVHEKMYGQVRSEARRLLSHLATWVARAERGLEAAQQLVQRFDRAHGRATEILAQLQPAADVKPVPERLTLPPTPDAPIQQAATSRTDFDPREPPVKTSESDDVVITPLGSGAGYRVRTGGRV
jgi:hypothetical protein